MSLPSLSYRKILPAPEKGKIRQENFVLRNERLQFVLPGNSLDWNVVNVADARADTESSGNQNETPEQKKEIQLSPELELFFKAKTSFLNKVVKQEGNKTVIRSNLTNINDCNKWVKEYGLITNSKWNVRTSAPCGKRIVFSKKYVCHRSSFMKVPAEVNKRGYSKNTHCPAKLTVRVKKSTRSIKRTDEFVKEGKCGIIVLENEHNHGLNTSEALRCLPPDPDCSDTFIEYFKAGLTVSQSCEHHQEVLRSREDFSELDLDNHRINPVRRTVQRWYELWRLGKDAKDKRLRNRPLVDDGADIPKEVEENKAGPRSRKQLAAESVSEELPSTSTFEPDVIIKEEPIDYEEGLESSSSFPGEMPDLKKQELIIPDLQGSTLSSPTIVRTYGSTDDPMTGKIAIAPQPVTIAATASIAGGSKPATNQQRVLINPSSMFVVKDGKLMLSGGASVPTTSGATILIPQMNPTTVSSNAPQTASTTTSNITLALGSSTLPLTNFAFIPSNLPLSNLATVQPANVPLLNVANQEVFSPSNPKSSRPSSPSTIKIQNLKPKVGVADSQDKQPPNGNGGASKSSSGERIKDEFDKYGEFIASKLRQLDWRSCAYVQKAFGDILFEADLQRYACVCKSSTEKEDSMPTLAQS